MRFMDLNLPQNLRCEEIFKGPSITPLQRLEVMDPSKFEELTEVWLLSKLNHKYKSLKRNAGPGDKGRDIVAYYIGSDKIDIYQCKHYKDSLSWSDMREEFLKLCYYTYFEHYDIPQAYYIVSTKGCSSKFRTDFLDKTQSINPELVKFVRGNNIKIERSILNKINGFINYIEKFDFSIVIEKTPAELIEEFWDSKYRPYYFGGGLKLFVKEEVIVPQTVCEDEREYINQLLAVYSEQENAEYKCYSEIDAKYKRHFELQRTYYYSIESFRRCVRDNLPSMEPFEEVEETIHQGLNDIIWNPQLDGFSKLTSSLSRSVEMNMDSCILKSVLYPNDKKGVCHRLVNKKEIGWV